jgi:hypothetical protein
VNVFHVRDVDGMGSINDLLTKWVGHGWLIQQQSFLSNEITFETVTARLLIPYGTGSQFVNYAPSTTGSNSTQAAPLNACAVVTWYDGLIGRTNRGRTFTSGFARDAQDKGLLSSGAYSGFTTNVAAFFAYWKTGGTSVHYELGVWSRKNAGHTPPYSSTAFQPITEYTTRTWVRSQRRRDYGISIGRSA